ncbi:MAG: hypothetical protein S4CHLAM37_07430 [Chlamydiia bacterium]|nr:hypothetical protein [Chlamydiia bacterium]
MKNFGFIFAAITLITGCIEAAPPPQAYVISNGDLFAPLTSINIKEKTTTTIRLSGTPQDLAITPDGTQLFVATINDNVVDVIDTTTNQQSGNPIFIDNYTPTGIVISQDGKFAYLTVSISTNPNSGQVTGISIPGRGNTNFPFPSGIPENLFVLGSTFFAVNSDNTNTFGIYGLNSKFFDNPKFIDLSCGNTTPCTRDIFILGGGHLFVLTSNSSLININLAIGGVPGPQQPLEPGISYEKLFISPSITGDEWGVVLSKEDDVVTTYIFDLANDTGIVRSHMPSGSVGPHDAVFSHDRKSVYVLNQSAGTVTKYNKNAEPLATIKVGANPNSIAITPDGTELYVANFASNSVTVINTITHSTQDIPVGSGPTKVIITPTAATFAKSVLENTVKHQPVKMGKGILF